MPVFCKPHVAQECGQLGLTSACVSGESVSLLFTLVFLKLVQIADVRLHFVISIE